MSGLTRPIVLHVEDSGTCAHHFASRLTRAPHHAIVHTAWTLELARAWLRGPESNGLTLAVLDLELPDGSGLELLPLLVGVPVLVVTGDSKKLVTAGCFEVIEKGPAWMTKIEAKLTLLRLGT